MPISKFLFLSSKHRFSQALTLFQRYSSGQSNRFQARTFASSRSHGNGDQIRRSVRPVITEAPQQPRSYFIPAAATLILGFAGFGAFVRYNDDRRSVLKGQGSNCNTCTKGQLIGGPYILTDTENRTVTEKDFLNKWVLLYFGYTSSPDVGHEQVQMMADTINILESKHNAKILPVFVTIDPQRDTPAQLRAYLQEFDSRLVGLTGPVTAIRQMAQEFRVFFRKFDEEGNDYLVESSHNMYLIGPNMEVVRCFGVEYTAEELSEAIVTQLKQTPS